MLAKMKIMEIVSGRGVNGAVVTCLGTARALRARGHEVTVVCRPNAWIADQLQSDDIPIILSELKRWPIRDLRDVAKVAKDQSFDVIHTHMSSASFFGVLLRAFSRVPSVATAHNRHIQLHWMFNDYVIAVSEATRRFHRLFNLVRPSRIEVVHNFVNEKRFADLSRSQGSELRRELGIPGDSPLIAVIGDVIARKGVLYLLRAMPRILQSHPHAHLLCVGANGSEYGDQMRKEAIQLGIDEQVTWAGQRSDVENVLAATDLCVLPSLEENLPISILEAMAAGRAVIATAVGGIPECVVHETTGLLVPPAQSEPLADAVIRLLADDALRAAYGRQAQQNIREQFSVNSYCERVEDIFQRVAA